MSTFKDLLTSDIKDKLKQISKNDKIDTDDIADEPINLSKKTQHAKTLPADDNVLFAQAMTGVRPLKNKKSITPVKSDKKPADPTMLLRRAAAQGGEELGGDKLSDMQALMNPVAGESYLSYKVATLQNRVFDELKAGKLHWHDAVDLHGANIDDARQAVLTLIHQARQNGETVVKIVHGKGADGVLKTCVNGWLRQIPDVLAFVSAPTKNGGNGAVLVLLKKQSRPT